MSGLQAIAFEGLSAADKGRVNEICERFEAALRSGEPVSPEPYLDGAAGALRTVVLREFVALECELRLAQGHDFSPKPWQERFPEDSAVIDEAVAHVRLRAEQAGLPDHDVVAALAVKGFRIVRPIGEGGFGIVYLAEAPHLNGTVALKVLRPHLSFDPQLRQRFLSEARAVNRLKHPNIVPVLEADTAGPCCYLVMPYISGVTLADWLRDHPAGAPIQAGAAIVQQLAAAVQHAHEHGVLHRDLKPANVLLKTGELESSPIPLLTDFGLARVADEPMSLTPADLLLGTPPYMAPEQTTEERQAITERTDVYTLGAILYEVLTGRPPFPHGRVIDVLLRVRVEEPILLRALRPEIPPALSTICMKCLEKDPRRRYASAAAVADDLYRFQRGEPTLARPAGLLERGWRWCRKKPLAASLGGVAASLLVLVLVSAAISVYEWRQSVELAQQERGARLRLEKNWDIATRLVAQLAAVGSLELMQEYDAQRQHQRDFLQQAESFCLELLKEPEAGDEIRLTLAVVYVRMSSLYGSAGDVAAAQQAAEKAISQWYVLADANPGTARYDLGAARAECQLADIRLRQGDPAKALIFLRRSYGRMRPHVAKGDVKLALEWINVKQDIGVCFTVLARRAEALAVFSEVRDDVLSLINDTQDSALQERLAGIYEQMGIQLAHCGESAEAQKSWNQARALYRQLLTENFRADANLVLARSRALAYKQDLASCCITAAQFAGGGEADYREAMELLEEVCRELSGLSHEDPSTVSRTLGRRHYQLAQCYQALGRFPAALAASRASVQHYEDTMRRRPADFHVALLWLESLGRLAELQEKSGRHADATSTLQRLSEGMEQQVQTSGADRVQQAVVASGLLGLSANLRTISASAQSLDAANAARRIFEQLATQVPTEVAYQIGLCEAWSQVAKCYWRFDDYDRVLHACRQALAISRGVCEHDPKNVEYRGMLDDRHVKLERILGHLKRRGEVLESILEREKLWPGNSDRLRKIVQDLRQLAEEVSDDKKDLSPADLAERQTYLDHAARVERAIAASLPGERGRVSAPSVWR